jgi:hypothetical protein
MSATRPDDPTTRGGVIQTLGFAAALVALPMLVTGVAVVISLLAIIVERLAA